MTESELAPNVQVWLGRGAGARRVQIMAYGYASADTYSFPGGAGTRKIYEPPILK